MPQSSLIAWLKKPPAVTQPLETLNEADKQPKQHEAQEQLPPPPCSSAPKESEPDARTETGTLDASNTALKALPKTARPPLPPNVEICACTKADVPAFKRINSLLLPIPYPESFYREILEDSLTKNITLLATWHDDPATIGKEKGRLIGAIRCRLFAHALSSHSDRVGTGEKPMLYLSTLVLLSPYRSHGIAAHLLHLLTVRAIKQYGIGSIGAHVWEANQEGLDWYAKRGFEVVGEEADYYRRLKPSGAVVVRREVKVADLMGG